MIYRPIGYARASTTSQPNSIARQRDNIKRYAAQHLGVGVSTIYRDVASGRLGPGHRKGLYMALDALSDGTANCLIYEHFDRLARSGEVACVVLGLVAKAQATLMPVDSSVVENTWFAMPQQMHQMFVGMLELRTKAGVLTLSRKMRAYFTERGDQPLWFDEQRVAYESAQNDGDNLPRTLIVKDRDKWLNRTSFHRGLLAMFKSNIPQRCEQLTELLGVPVSYVLNNDNTGSTYTIRIDAQEVWTSKVLPTRMFLNALLRLCDGSLGLTLTRQDKTR